MYSFGGQVKQEAQGLPDQPALQETLASRVNALPSHIIPIMHVPLPDHAASSTFEPEST